MQIREPDGIGDRQRRQRFFLHTLVLLLEQAMQDNVGDARAVQSDQCGVTPGAPMPRRTSEPGMLGLGRLTLALSNNAVILLCRYLCTAQHADFRMDARSRHSVVMPPN